ncbi:MAG: colicin uptake protein [Limisphaerales bacterium]|nr:MAG: colicin uptake protein [Limisphaerales bacterium]KAG0509863.1 MAG: colicin uptake protein [Limisphaerales bacterium]TXT50915.1 MAG: colicin uptake protein [Limisphaerales bacterium]
MRPRSSCLAPAARVLALAGLLASLTLARGAAPVDYAKDIKPLLRERCYACHGALKQNNGLRLDTADLMKRGGKHGPAIVARKPGQSLLLTKVSATDLAERMPPEGDALKPEQIELLRRWIAAGAPAPRDEKPEPSPSDHWAFKPVVRPPLPKIGNRQSAISNPVDSFTNARLAAAKLTPLPPAEKPVLLRRVYLDLTGLPPTREELQAFLTDTSPDAYERVVDRLLNSPQHGERWARHWMDVWRYSDWFGRRQVPDVWNSAPQIWRWRDWIVKSLNADHGYDRMVKAMLAADEIAPLDDESAVATGYLVRNWYALNPNDWMRANVEHTGKAFLGLTFNCAHCHDHKYDPITQADYFSFRAFFEPLYVRQDRWPGEADPGAFQDYDYSKNRKVVRLGSVRVFDKDAAAKTWFYTGGDERNRLTNHPPVLPTMPEFLGGKSLQVTPVSLPGTVSYPGGKPFIREAELKRVDDALAAAKQIVVTNKTALTEARLATAEAERASVLARLAADEMKFGAPSIARQEASDTDALARAACKAERQFKLAAAKETLAKAEVDVATAKTNSAAAKDDKAKAATKTALTKAEAALTAAKKAVTDAEAVLAKDSADYTAFSPVYPRESTGRRKALAEWIASRQNPLTARVAVNHIWARHFHEPLVASVFDFGRAGKPPTHPELLDWLAAEFMESGWSMKHLHRLIVTSAAYRRSSSSYALRITHYDPVKRNDVMRKEEQRNATADPENRLLWRMNPGRMEAEAVRDSILHLAGALDPRLGGQELENKDALTTTRRSLYYSFNPESDGRSEFSALFDAPDPNDCYRRTRSVIPQQALALTNSKLVHDHAAALAKRLGAPASDPAISGNTAFITAAFEHLLTRPPSRAEFAECEAFLKNPLEKGDKESDVRSHTSLVRALLNHNDFLTVR